MSAGRGKPAPASAVDAAKNSLGGAYGVAQNLAKQPIPGAKQIASSLVATANQSFVEAFRWGLVTGGIVLLVGAVIVVLFLPARAMPAQVIEQTEELAAEDALTPQLP